MDIENNLMSEGSIYKSTFKSYKTEEEAIQFYWLGQQQVVLPSMRIRYDLVSVISMELCSYKRKCYITSQRSVYTW